MTTDALKQTEQAPTAQEPPADGMLERTKQGAQEQGYRGFVAPVETNTRFLIKAGTPFAVRDPNSPTGERLTRRDGDQFVQFHGGSLTTNDPDVIAWCEAHSVDPKAHEAYHKGRKDACTLRQPEICVDVDHDQAAVWFYAKRAQLNLGNQEPSLPGNVDVGAFMRGEAQDLGGPAADVVQRTRAMAEQANSQ